GEGMHMATFSLAEVAMFTSEELTHCPLRLSLLPSGKCSLGDSLRRSFLSQVQGAILHPNPKT
ncbi:MAG: hypothetical protein ACRCX7_13645, partial [Cetobacterium sp.]|uniref:hypothetical protein n=1 Tax=Cetobacterium sp. TaxID=2071632 RepID=UPI003F3EDF52